MPEHPRLQLHQSVQQALNTEELTPGLGDIVVVRWALVAEVAMSEQRMGLVTVASTASGADLRSWELVGLLGKALHRAFVD